MFRQRFGIFPVEEDLTENSFFYENIQKAWSEHVNTNPLPQFLLDERFEYREQHIENVRIVEYVNGLQSQC